MPIELHAIDDDNDNDDSDSLDGESDGESAEQQLATAEKLDAELRGSLGAPDDAGGAATEGDAADEKGDAKPEGEPKPDGTADKPKGDRKGWKYKGLRLKEQELARQRAELHAGYQTLAQQQAAAKEYQEAAERIRQLAVTSPRAAAREFARLTGQPAEDLYQSWTEERLKGGTEPEHDKLSQVPPAIRQLLDEQAEQIRQLREGHEKFTTAAQQREAVLIHQDNCARVLAKATVKDDEMGYVMPYLATMPPAKREDFVAAGARMAAQLQMEDGEPRHPEFVAKRLDHSRMVELRDQLQALTLSALQAILPAGLKVVKGGTSQDGAHSAGGANGRDQGSKQRGKRGLGNRAGAQTSTGARPVMSRAEIEQQLDERLRASLRD